MSDPIIERIISAPIEEVEAMLKPPKRYWYNDRCKWCLAETIVDWDTRSCATCLDAEEARDA